METLIKNEKENTYKRYYMDREKRNRKYTQIDHNKKVIELDPSF